MTFGLNFIDHFAWTDILFSFFYGSPTLNLWQNFCSIPFLNILLVFWGTF